MALLICPSASCAEQLSFRKAPACHRKVHSTKVAQLLNRTRKQASISRAKIQTNSGCFPLVYFQSAASMDGFAHMGMPGGMGMAGGMFLPGGMQGMMQLPPGMMEPDFGPFSQPGMGRGPPFPRPPFPGPMSQEAAIDESSRRPGSLNGQIFHKTRLCVKWKEGYCHFGDRCNFAHGEHELRYVPPEVVSQFEQHKRIQDQAGLGPGGSMLPVGPAPRPPPPAGPMPPPRPQQSMTPPRQQDGVGPSTNGDSIDGQPTSRELFFKTRLCDKFMNFGDCPYGDRCHYAHGYQDMRQKGSVTGNSGQMMGSNTASKPPAMNGVGPRPPGPRPPPGPPPPGHPSANSAKSKSTGKVSSPGSTQPAAEVSYVERIRAMSALFKVGEMATSEVSQAALQAALNSVRDGSIFAANHYADALDIYV